MNHHEILFVLQAEGTTLSEIMRKYGLKRAWYEFDFLARRRILKHIEIDLTQ